MSVMRKKTGETYLLNKAFRSSLTAALFSTLITHICSATDALITGNLIGPDALAAIGLTIPILTGLNCFLDLIMDGAIARASTDLGNQEITGMNRRLSVGLVLGYLLTVAAVAVLQLTLEPLSHSLVSQSEAIRRSFVDYMRIASGFYLVQTLIVPVPKIIRALGSPKMATQILTIVSLGNVLCDLIFVRLFRISGNTCWTTSARACRACWPACSPACWAWWPMRPSSAWRVTAAWP